MSRHGFTLIELIVVVMIVAVLVSVAVPTYFNTIERARGREARTTIQTVIGAQRSYSSERRSFIALTNNGEWLAIGLENPNNNANRSFDYTATVANNDAVPGNEDMTITAKRDGGIHDGMTIIFDSDTGWGGTFNP